MQTHILVLDDDSLLLRVVAKSLQRAGYRTTQVTSGEEALRAASKQTFNAALVDYDLPDADGLTVLSRLRDIQPKCLRILMTGHQAFPIVVSAVNRGEVLRVLPKPFEGRELLSCLSEAFASARRTQELLTNAHLATRAEQNRLLDELFAGDHLRLALQPIVSAAGTHRVRAYEALMRSTHHVLDGPMSVLAAAEQVERIPELGSHLLALAGGWIERLPPTVELFVNLHPLQLADRDHLRASLAGLEPHAHRVALELTERSRLQDIEGWEETLAMLQDVGFSIAVDDLGSGYNSLGMLADLQPRYIKLDMGLIRDVHHIHRKQRIVRMMATFAEATDAFLIAEGVENAEEGEVLEACGSHLLQGFFYGRPSLAPDLSVLEQENQNREAVTPAGEAS